MERIPLKNVNIVVGLKLSQKFYFAVTPTNLVILNLTKLTSGQFNYFFAHPEFNFVRENCKTLETTEEIAVFFKNLRRFEVSPEKLSHDLSFAVRGRGGKPEDFCPSLFIDFDTSTLYYSDEALAKHQSYLPKGFKIKRTNFLELIPKKYQFWKMV